MSWMLLCLTVSGYFAGNDMADLPVWLQIPVWLPFCLLLSRDIYLAWQRFRYPAEDSPPQSVSAVIPVRNEAERIAACIDSLYQDNAVKEVIAVDGGSTDETVILAGKAAPAIRHTALSGHGGGRGGQIHAGIMVAKGDVVAIVHADTLITTPVFTQIIEVLGRQPMSSAALWAVFSTRLAGVYVLWNSPMNSE